MKKANVWAAGLVMGLVIGAAHAQHVKVEDGWVRATVAGQKATGAFMAITADQDMTLVGVSTPVAGVSQVHEMVMQNDVMRMAELKAGLPLPAGQTVTLKPGGYHLMFMDLKQPVKEGQTLDVTIVLRDAQGKEIAQALQLPARPLNMGMQHGKGEHGDMKGGMKGHQHGG